MRRGPCAGTEVQELIASYIAMTDQEIGLIAKKRDLLDERRVLVDLTPAGQALQASVWASYCRSAVAPGSASAPRPSGQTMNVLA